MNNTEEKEEKNIDEGNTAEANACPVEEPEQMPEAEPETPDPDRALKEAEARIAELEAKIKDCEDKYLRMAAEYDNFRRRSREERESVYLDAVADAVKPLLPIIDNLERAALYKESDKLAEGIAITAKSVDTMLAELGIDRIGKVGEKFDPNIHNAVMHIEDDSLGVSTVAEVFMKGYRKGDKIIRFAMVKVAN